MMGSTPKNRSARERDPVPAALLGVIVMLATAFAVLLWPGANRGQASPPGARAGAGRMLPCGPGVDFLGFSDSLDKTQFRGTDVGGLSGLTYDPDRDVYYALVDNQQATPARFYTVRTGLRGNKLRDPRVVNVTFLRDSSGLPFTGENFDGEDVALLRAHELLISSETEPSIRRFSLAGRLLQELPVPERFLVAPRGEAQVNQTFESLALARNRRVLFAAMEGSLRPDGRTEDGRSRVRFLRYERRSADDFQPVAQLFYLTEPNQGVADISALSRSELLVLERGFVAGQFPVQVFRVRLRGAIDVTGERPLAAPGLVPLAKTLLVDLSACPQAGAPSPSGQIHPLLDNFETVKLGQRLRGGRRVLFLLSDDNFSTREVTRLIALAARL